MTHFASVALFRRNGEIVFRSPRLERAAGNITQARKAASRYWGAAIKQPDVLTKIVVVSRSAGGITVSERTPRVRPDAAWADIRMTLTEAASLAHLAACMAALGIDPTRQQPELPDIIEINGVIYRRDI